MEPFELKLHQVTFDESSSDLTESDADLRHSSQQTHSFDTLVHYDANLREATGLENAPKSVLSTLDTGRSRSSVTTTITTSARRAPVSVISSSSPSSAGHSSSATSRQASLVSASAQPWDPLYGEDQENFLVNPDDYYLTPTNSCYKVTPKSAAEGLRTLSLVSINTAAVARHLRKVHSGKRRVAKTTVTSTALVTPLTMPSELPQQPGSLGTPPQSGQTQGMEGGAGQSGDVGESSFETVAEALRLQWSVIGNIGITPAPPEVVAQIVAEAEKRLRAGAGVSGSPLNLPSLTDTGSAADTSSAGSLSSLSSLSSLTVNDSGGIRYGAGEGVAVGQERSWGTSDSTVQGKISEAAGNEHQKDPGSTGLPPSNLVRIPPQYVEVERSSKMLTKTRASLPSLDENRAVVNVSSSKMSKGSYKVVTDDRLRLDSTESYAQKGSAAMTASQQSGGLAQADEKSPVPAAAPQKLRTGQISVPFGTGITSPGDQSFNSPTGVTPFTSPFVDSSVVTKTDFAFLPHGGQNPAQKHQPFQQLAVSDYPKSQTQALVHNAPNNAPLLPLPVFSPQTFPMSQIGPLFSRKTTVETLSRPQGLEIYVGSMATGGGGFEAVMREKLKLEGQLEVLQVEAESMLQERAQLQAQLASIQLKLKSGQHREDDTERSKLRAELERLRATRVEHEREALEVQHMLEEKMEELKVVTEDLYQSQDTVDKLQVRMKEMRDDLQAREVTVQALKGKIAELYVEVQTTIQSKMEADGEARTARNDLLSLVKAKEWYQEQLSTAHEVRAKLQRQLTQLQAQTVSQGSIVERLKQESSRLRQHLRESQERALRDKEQLARHLEVIQQDMMEREAAFQEIQRERLMIEDTFNTQVTTVEEEKTRIQNLLQLTAELESQLEQAYTNSKKKQEMVFSLENQHMELMKKMTLAQEVLVEKERLLEESSQKLIEVESQVKGFKEMLAAKDAELLKLREDKATTEIALKAALQEKGSVDRALDTLKGDMVKVERSFKQMRQELGVRQAELEAAQNLQKAARDELDRVAHELDIKNRTVDSLTRSVQEQTTHVQQILGEKASIEHEVALLKQQLEKANSEKPADGVQLEILQSELQETKAQLAEAERQLNMTTLQLQQASFQTLPASSSETVTSELDSLRLQLEMAEHEQLQSSLEQQQEKVLLQEELSCLKAEMVGRKQDFESQVQAYLEQVRVMMEEKQRLETELEMARRTLDLASVQQKEQINAEIQKLMKELEEMKLHRQSLEVQLLALQEEKAQEVAALQQQLHQVQQALQEAAQQVGRQQEVEQLHQQLALELEKERGRIAGLQQSNSTLKEHTKQLEEALARRESSLVELNISMELTGREREREQQDYLRRIQDLELTLKKEKDGSRDLRKQIGSKITESKRLQKQQEISKKELLDLQQEVQNHRGNSEHLQQEVDVALDTIRRLQGEVQQAQQDKQALEVELEKAKQELADSADRNPVLLQQIQSLEWQVLQQTQEVEDARQQLTLAEQRQVNESDSLRRALQGKQEEVEKLHAELAAARQEKADQRNRVSELRSVLKASFQHHKLTRKLNSRKKDRVEGDDSKEDKGTQADMGNGVIIPPLPFDMEAVEKLLHDTAVRPLDSKPLDNLSSCLSSLRAEISGLQKQMDAHTITVHTSAQSWRSVESEVKGLQEVVRSIANTIMDASHTSTAAITSSASDIEIIDDSGIVHL